VPVGDVVLFLTRGLILFADKLARLRVPIGDFQWIAMLRANGVLEVPYADRERLLDALFRLPQVSNIDLPDALQVPQRQTRRVFAYRIICRDTVEDRILELQKSKRDLADAIISADNSLIRSLTQEDLELLLS